jgi:hypothetical protein
MLRLLLQTQPDPLLKRVVEDFVLREMDIPSDLVCFDLKTNISRRFSPSGTGSMSFEKTSGLFRWDPGWTFHPAQACRN